MVQSFNILAAYIKDWIDEKKQLRQKIKNESELVIGMIETKNNSEKWLRIKGTPQDVCNILNKLAKESPPIKQNNI
jgi:hypothetical protein